MTPEQWKQVKLLFERVINLEPSQEKIYLEYNCQDESIRREVESLLANHREASNFFLDNESQRSSVLAETKVDSEQYFNNLIGTKLNNTYLIEEMIGVGGMGAVFRCTHLLLGNQVAIKIMPPTLTNNTTFVKRFRREARVGWTLSHPNIVKVLEFSQNSDGLFFMVMEYVKAKTLKNCIEESAPMPLNRCLEILEPLCNALDIAHKHRILHRDLKPANILIGRQDGAEIVKLADFGIVKLLEADSQITTEGEVLTGKGTIIGSPNYMSPEQLMNYKLSSSSDIYSLGVILYEMITGQLPFSESNFQELITSKVKFERFSAPSTKVPSLPLSVDKVLQKALAPSPQNRYQTAKDLFEAFKNVLVFTVQRP